MKFDDATANALMLLLMPFSVVFLFFNAVPWNEGAMEFFMAYQYVSFSIGLQFIITLALVLMMIWHAFQMAKLGEKRNKLLRESNIDIEVGRRVRVKK